MYSQTLHACRFTCENPENFLARLDLLAMRGDMIKKNAVRTNV